MIYTSPKSYGFIEVGQKIIGGREFSAKVTALCADVFGVEAVAATTILDLVPGDEIGDDDLVMDTRPIEQPLHSEIQAGSDYQVVLMHRGFPVADAWRYPDMGHVKSELKKPIKGIGEYHPSLFRQFKDIADSHGLPDEGAPVRFDQAEFLATLGTSRMLGLRLQVGHKTTQMLAERAAVVEERLKKYERLARLPQPFNLAMIVARIDLPEQDKRANRLLELIQVRMPQVMTMGRVALATDDLLND